MALPRNRIDGELNPGMVVQLPSPVARHMCQVLRLQINDKIILFNGRDGRDYTAVITQIDKQQTHAQIVQRSEPEPRAPLCIHLLLGISRGERMDFAIQKSVELGVQSITPLFTQRSVVKLTGNRLQNKLSHWQRIMDSACEQSGRRWSPRLNPAQKLSSWLNQKQGQDQGSIVLLSPEANKSFRDIKPENGKITFLIGPEGGFSPQEEEQVCHNGCTRVRLGPHVLRTETAPLAAISAAQTLWGSFR